MKASRLKISVIALVSLLTVVTLALPSLTAHINTNATIAWERDGSQNGDSAHNHHSTNDFNGRFSTAEPFSVQSCWDSRFNRLDTAGDFDSGHCFINETNNANRVRYRFNGTNWNANAQARTREAFEVYNDVMATGNNVTGIEFVETTGTAEIDIFWEDQNGVNNGGFWRNSDRELHFDNSMNWFYGRDPMEGQPGGIQNGQWHFFTVILHEVGHAVGFVHQTDAADVMSPPVGQPPDIAGHRYFAGLDNDTLEGVRSLYSQPAPSTGPDANCSVDVIYHPNGGPTGGGYFEYWVDASGSTPGLTPIALYTWDNAGFGGPSSPTHTNYGPLFPGLPGQASSYTITVTVTDTSGQSDSAVCFVP